MTSMVVWKVNIRHQKLVYNWLSLCKREPPPPLRMWPQPFSPMLYRIGTKAQDNCGKSMPIQSAISLQKWLPARRFDMQAADRRSPIQVLNPAPSCLTWATTWCWTPILHTEHCRSKKLYFPLKIMQWTSFGVDLKHWMDSYNEI